MGYTLPRLQDKMFKVSGELVSREEAIITKPGEDRAQTWIVGIFVNGDSIHDQKPRVIEVPAKDNGVSL